ncbi:hypothetical protein L1887_32691 [Cichorium endivia]|nr:hypothetical protein L1887_32691 [Cichorium endivia]
MLSSLFPPEGKTGIYLKTFDAGYRLPTSDFMEEVLRRTPVGLHQLTPNSVNKIVAFELLCRSHGIAPDFYIFKHYFRFAAVGDNYAFYRRSSVHALVPEPRYSPKNWQDHWLWVNASRVGTIYYCPGTAPDQIPKLYPHQEAVVKTLNSFQVVADEFPEHILAGGGMSTAWRMRGKMSEFFVVQKGVYLLFFSPFFCLFSCFYHSFFFFVCLVLRGVLVSCASGPRKVRFEEVLSKSSKEKYQYREVDLVDRVPPSFSFRNPETVARIEGAREEERLGKGQPGEIPLIDAKVEGLSKRDSGKTDEFVVDSKEGVIEEAAKLLVKRKVAWDAVEGSESSRDTRLIRRISRRRLLSQLKEDDLGIIDIPDDDVPKGSELALESGVAGGRGKGKEKVGEEVKISGSEGALDLGKKDSVSVEVEDVDGGDGGESEAGGGNLSPKKGGDALGTHVWRDYSSLPFVPDWKLLNSSRLSSREAAIDFALHAFPPAADSEMESFTHDGLVSTLRFASTQSAYYLAAAAKRIEHLANSSKTQESFKLEARKAASENVRLHGIVEELRGEVARLEKKSRDFDLKYELLMSEKMSVEEQLSGTQERLDKVSEENEALMIRAESFDAESCEKDRLLEEGAAALAKAEGDLRWVVEEGMVRVVEKVFKIPELIHGVNRIRRTSFIAGEDAGRRALRQELNIAGPDVEEGSSSSNYAHEVKDAMEEFATLDYAGLLRLGQLSVEELKELLRVEADE